MAAHALQSAGHRFISGCSNHAKERSLPIKSIYLIPKCGIAFRNIGIFPS